MSNLDLNVIIIDDNRNIHEDLKSVLTNGAAVSKQFDKLDAELFGEKEQHHKKQKYLLPNFHFDTADQGRDGVRKVIQSIRSGKPYALAFVDIRMPPGINGIRTIKRIWKIDPKIQVVICTAYSDYSWEDTVSELGMNDNFVILKKPFDHAAVRQLACALSNKWLATQNIEKETEYLKKSIAEQSENLNRSLSLLKTTLDSTTDAMFATDPSKNIIDYNLHFVKLLGIPEVVLEARNESLVQEYLIRNLLSPEDYVQALDKISQDKSHEVNLLLEMKNGKIFEFTSKPYVVKEDIKGRVWRFHDVTQRTFLEKELEYRAMHDDLTNLPNRILLHDRISQLISVGERSGKKFAVLFLDLDRFKLINDSLGHNIGDDLLCDVAKRLQAVIRKDDTISRLSGDEFIIVLSDLHNNEDVTSIAYKLLSIFEEPFAIDKHELAVTCSVGISLFPQDGTNPNQLLKNADMAMYKAKELGGNTFQYFTRQLNVLVKTRLRKEIELRKAIRENELFIVYQPQIDIHTKKVLSLEALLRWQHPQKGLLYPNSFISIAEESGLILQVAEWQIREICRQIVEWHRAGFPYLRVAINVTTQQLRKRYFVENTLSVLKEFSLSPKYLEIEVTENVIITHKDVLSVINDLKAHGFSIVLDDFGTGNSSLNYLKKIEIDRLKIDKSFVKNISKSHTDEVIIESVIAISKSFNFKVLAEGVEEEYQADFLKSKNCDEVQGFFYSKPLLPDAVTKYIKATDV